MATARAIKKKGTRKSQDSEELIDEELIERARKLCERLRTPQDLAPSFPYLVSVTYSETFYGTKNRLNRKRFTSTEVVEACSAKEAKRTLEGEVDFACREARARKDILAYHIDYGSTTSRRKY